MAVKVVDQRFTLFNDRDLESYSSVIFRTTATPIWSYRVSEGGLAWTTVLVLLSIPCDSRQGGTEPLKYLVYSNYHFSTRPDHDVRFHLPVRSNGSVKIRYLNGLAVDRDVSQPEGLECSGDPQRSSSHTQAWGEVLWHCHALPPSFSSPETSQPSESPAPILKESDEAILPALSEGPFASMRQPAPRTYLQTVKKVPGPPAISRGTRFHADFSPSRVIRENHARQTIIKNSLRDNHKMK
jgi:hypothetical protein